jgi:exosortase/archaeosortase family protein
MLSLLRDSIRFKFSGCYPFLGIVSVLNFPDAILRRESIRYLIFAMTTETKIALILLSLTALVRLVGQILNINVIGALALIVDVYALGLLLGLQHRQRAVSPFWLAVLFAFALPLERVMQHTIGYGLQLMSAAGACQILSLGTEFVQCEGVRILLAGKDVLVDLPCSGARGLLLLFILFSALAAITRPTWYYASIGVAITLMAAFIVNVIRIVLLAIGLAYADTLGGIDVMAPPYHEFIGFTALGIGMIPIVLWAMKGPKPLHKQVKLLKVTLTPNWQVRLIALMFVILAMVIINLPTYPIDVARKIESPILPNFIGEFPAVHGSLSPNEQKFFTQYGGGSAKASYGQFGLLLVSTSAPLRHLHTPMECLGSEGHKIRYVISTYGRLPAAIYHSTDPKEQRWQIRVTFVDENGTMTPYVSEVAWQWLQNRQMTWTMIQRIAPLSTPKTEIEEWDIAVARALELPFYQEFKQESKL